MNTSEILTQYMHLCIANIRSASVHHDEQVSYLWLNKLICIIRLADNIGLYIANESYIRADYTRMYFARKYYVDNHIER